MDRVLMVDLETPEKIHFAIEKKLSLGSSYIDALVEYAKEKDLEIETVAEIVKKSAIIKEKIRTEARSKRLLKEKNDNRTSFFE
jgi:hypothetical protein